MQPEYLEELLSAYLDGELDERAGAVVEQLLKQDDRARRLLDELRLTVQLVSSMPRHTAPDSIVSDVEARIERQTLLDESPAARVHTHHGRRTLLVFLSLAAMLAIMIPLGWYLAAQSSRKLAQNMLAKSDNRIEEPGLIDKSPDDAGLAFRSKRTAREGQTSHITKKDGRTPADAGMKPHAEAIAASRGDTTAKSQTEAEPITFEQKLARGSDPVSLRQHEYAAEPVQLQVVVRDEKDRDALASRLASKLSESQVANLADEAVAKQVGLLVEQPVFDIGKLGINYLNPSHRQLIVRARVQELDSVFKEIESAGPSNGKVELQIAGQRVRGVEPARQNVLALARSPEGDLTSDLAQRELLSLQALAAAAPFVPSEVDEDASSSMISGLLQVVGIDAQSSRELGRKFAESVARRTQQPESVEMTVEGDASSGSGLETEGGLVERSLSRVATARNRKAGESQEPSTEEVAPTIESVPPKQTPDRVDQGDAFVTLVIDIAVEDNPSPRPPNPSRPSKPVNGTMKKNN